MNIRKTFAICILVKSIIISLLLISIFSCQKESAPSPLHYYEVGFKGTSADWRDSSFVIATNNPPLIAEIVSQLNLPAAQRKIVTGRLSSGSCGYNKNATHESKWHFKESDWHLTELSADIYDGRPYSDVDTDINYCLHSMKRFAPWSSYIEREILLP